MKKSLKATIICLLAVLFLFSLFGCNFAFSSESESSQKLTVTIEEEDMETLYIGEEYDFEPYIVTQEGVDYAIVAEYLDGSFEYVGLTVSGYKFTQSVFADVYVTLTATKGDETATEKVTLTINRKADALDSWLLTKWSDDGVTKSLESDPMYVKEGSQSSLKIAYLGNASIFNMISLDNMDDYWSMTNNWSNAVLEFDVYNPNEATLTFAIYVMHKELGLKVGLVNNPQVIIEGNSWGKVVLSYAKIGLNIPFEKRSDTEWDDNIIQVRYGAATNDGSAYPVSFYIDNMDVCDYDSEKYPDLNVINYYPYEKDDLTNCYLSKGNVSAAAFDESQKSGENGYALKVVNTTHLQNNTSQYLGILVCESNGWYGIDASGKDLVFDVKFDNSRDWLGIAIDNRIHETVNGIGGSAGLYTDIKNGTKGIGYEVVALENGWLRVSIDLDAVYGSKDGTLFSSAVFNVLITFHTGQCDTEKDSVVYLDNMKFVDSTGVGYTQADVDEQKDLFTKVANEGGIQNGGDGWAADSLSTDVITSNGIGNKSIKISINAENSGWLGFKVMIAALNSGWSNYNLSGKIVCFDVKLENTKMFSLGIGSNAKYCNIVDNAANWDDGWERLDLGNGWYRVYFDIDVAFPGASSVFELIILLNAPDTENVSTAWFDNLVIASAGERNDIATLVNKEGGLEKGSLTSFTLDYDNKYTTGSIKALKLEIAAGVTADSWIGGGIMIAALNGWSAINCFDQTMTFYVKTENARQMVGFTVEHNGGLGVHNGLYISLSDGVYGTGYNVSAVTDGWYKLTVDMGMAFGDYSKSVFKVIVSINNGGESDNSKPSYMWIDCVGMAQSPDGGSAALKAEQEQADIFSKVSKEGGVQNGGDGWSADSIDLANSETSGTGNKSIKLSYDEGNVGWKGFKVMIAALNSGWSNFDLSGKTVSFDVKLENAKQISFDVGSVKYCNIVDNAGSWEDGWARYSIGNGWYRVYFDVDVIKAGANSVFELIILVNAGIDDSVETYAWFDNMKFTVGSEAKDLFSIVAKEGGVQNGGDGWAVSTLTTDSSILSEGGYKSVEISIDSDKNCWCGFKVMVAAANSWSNYSIDGKTLTFDVKLENTKQISVGVSSQTYYINIIDSTGDSNVGWSSQSLDNGWYRVSFDCDKAFSSSETAFEVIFMANGTNDYTIDPTATTYAWFDNLVIA